MSWNRAQASRGRYRQLTTWTKLWPLINVKLHETPIWVSQCARRHCHLWPVPLYSIFPHFLINGTIFGEKKKKKKITEHKMCVLIFSTTFICNISHSKKTERDVIKNIFWSSCNNLNFLDIFSKNTQYLISWKSFQWKPSCSIRTDGHGNAYTRFVRKRLKTEVLQFLCILKFLSKSG